MWENGGVKASTGERKSGQVSHRYQGPRSRSAAHNEAFLRIQVSSMTMYAKKKRFSILLVFFGIRSRKLQERNP